MSRLGGAVAFATGGTGLLIGALAIEPWSWTTVVGLAVGAGILVVGYWSGAPRMKEPSRLQAASPDQGDLAEMAVAWFAAAVAVGASIAIAYGARRLGEALEVPLDLGVVGALIGAAAMLYAALLQHVSDRRPRMTSSAEHRSSTFESSGGSS